MQIEKKIIHESKFSKKCPYTLYPKFITIHETANDASAANEINYMQGNPNQVSFHFAVDDKEVIQGLPLTRNAWHAGDGTFGDGNRESLSIEICYSKSGGSRYKHAKENAAELAAYLLNDYKLPISQLKKHQDWSGKYCPHRMLQDGKWNDFVELVKKKMEGEKMGFKEGYQPIAWQSQTIHVYKRKKDQEIGLMSAGAERVLKTINNIDDDHIHHCKVNCSYFVMGGALNGTVCGREQGFTRDGRPDQTQWLDVVVTNDGKVMAGDLHSWEYPKSEVKVGYSPAVILLLDGQDVTMISSESGQGKYTTPNTQTLHMQDGDGVDVLAVVSDKLNGAACRQFAKAYGMTFCAMLDSGGSSQMVVDGVKKVYTGRALPNVLTFYKKEEQPEPGPTPEPTPEPVQGELKLFVAKVGLNIRASLSFSNGRADGEKIGFIPVGEEAVITRFFDGIKPDGYQWVEVSYKGIIGYCQYDSQSYWIKESK